jgi:hypothetical protein
MHTRTMVKEAHICGHGIGFLIVYTNVEEQVQTIKVF